MGSCGTKLQEEKECNTNATSNLCNYWYNANQRKQKIPTLSPLDVIIYEQRLLFDAYLRIEIFNHLTNYPLCKFIPEDIINLCLKFYEIDIKSLSQNDNEIVGLTKLCIECKCNKEYFVAYKLGELLTCLDPESVPHRILFSGISFFWHLNSVAIELNDLTRMMQSRE